MRDIKLKRWNTRKLVVAGISGVAIAVAAGLTTPRYGLVNKLYKENAVEFVERKYVPIVDSLKDANDSLTGELAKKDTALQETITHYNTKLESLSSEYNQRKGELTGEYERRVNAAREELEMARRASLDSFLVQYPGFDRDIDYISSIGYWGSKPKDGSLDFEDFVTLKRSLEFMLEGHNSIVRDVLAGRAVVMNGEVSRQRTRDISVRDGEKYVFATDENGNPRGYGMDFDQYETEMGGK